MVDFWVKVDFFHHYGHIIILIFHIHVTFSCFIHKFGWFHQIWLCDHLVDFFNKIDFVYLFAVKRFWFFFIFLHLPHNMSKCSKSQKLIICFGIGFFYRFFKFVDFYGLCWLFKASLTFPRSCKIQGTQFTYIDFVITHEEWMTDLVFCAFCNTMGELT